MAQGVHLPGAEEEVSEVAGNCRNPVDLAKLERQELGILPYRYIEPWRERETFFGYAKKRKHLMPVPATSIGTRIVN